MSKKNELQYKYVTLPYDFIPFPDKWLYEYKDEDLPVHNKNQGLTGYIEYKLIPHSDLVVEVRKNSKGSYHLSGSMIKGKVRSNIEILSKSYPQFIDFSPILFRDFAGDDSESYKKTMNISSKIEQAVDVGFLIKERNEYYVVPAIKVGSNNNFKSIKEHELIQHNIRGFSPIYLWKDNDKKRFRDIQDKIDKYNSQIKKMRELYKEELATIQKEVTDLFMNSYSLQNVKNRLKDKKGYYQNELIRLKEELINELEKKALNNQNLFEFLKLIAERWMYKIILNFEYDSISRKKNIAFKPYQRTIYYGFNPENDKWIYSANVTKDTPRKAFLMNSTNASSKRSHYFIGIEEKGHDGYLVPAELKNGYDRNLKKISYIK